MAGRQWLWEPEVAAHTGICSQEAERGQGEGEMFSSLLFFSFSPGLLIYAGAGGEGGAFPPQPSLETASQTCPRVCSR